MDGILICRVSDRKQEDKYSLPNQKRNGREYAQEKGIRLIRQFIFQETASKANQRKKFDKIIELLWAAKRLIAVVVEKNDRLLRNQENAIVIKQLIKAGRIEVHFFKTGEVLDKKSDPSKILVHDVMTSVSTFQAANIGIEAIKGMEEKSREGWMPSRAPLGYINFERATIGRQSGRATTETIIVPNPDRRYVQWVIRMNELRAELLSFREIRRRCVEEGVVPPERVARFRTSQVEAVLKNPFYDGRFVWNGVEYEGKQELIVPRDLRARVNAIGAGKTRRKRKHDGALVGWIRCADCGCLVTYEPKTKPSGRRYDYYRCSNGKGFHTSFKYVTEDEILSRFEPAIDAVTLTEPEARQLSVELNRAHHLAQESKRLQMEGYRSSLKELENAEDQAYLYLDRKVLDEDGYKRQIARVREERQRYTRLLEEGQRAVDGTYLITAQRILELATRAKFLWNSAPAVERRELLEKLLQNPVLDAATVRYEMKKPFRVLASRPRNGEMLRIRRRLLTRSRGSRRDGFAPLARSRRCERLRIRQVAIGEPGRSP